MTGDDAVGRARAILATALDGLQITPHQQHAAIGAMLIFAATQPPPAHDRMLWERLIEVETLLTPVGNVWTGNEPKWQTDAYAILAALTPASDASASGEREAYTRGIEDAAKAFEDAIGEGYPVPPNKRDKCKHGLYGWESCIPCYDDALTAKITAVRAILEADRTLGGAGGGDG